MRPSTRIIRSTLAPALPGTPIHSGPVFAAAFHAPGDPSSIPYTYARDHNPTWTGLEDVIAQMESGPGYQAQVRVFASGIAACSAVFGSVLRPGDICVYPTNSYFTARHLMQEYFTQMGVELRMAATSDPFQADLYHGAKLVWLETPSNPNLDLCDIAALSVAAHHAGALVAVDNTTCTPLGQLPLALGADFSVSSDTKSMTGHSDLLVGHVAVRDPNLLARIHFWRAHTGAALGPMEAWLAHRSIATLPLRLERSCANAQAIAEFLTTRQDVEDVWYPGLPTHPQHQLAKRQMSFFGPVLGFTLKSKEAAESFMAKASLITDATSFGSVSTSAERRARWGGDAVPDGFIRLSAGCEAIEDLLEDLTQALDSSL